MFFYITFFFALFVKIQRKKKRFGFCNKKSRELMATCFCPLATPQRSTKTLQNPAIKENHGKCSCATRDALKELVPGNSGQVLAKLRW